MCETGKTGQVKVLRAKFFSKKGEALSARITLPDNEQPLSFALIAHCFTCNKNFNSVRNISKALAASGFGVLGFDFTGLGNSKGNFEDTNFSTTVDDVLSAANYLEKTYLAPTLIIGHSFGGPAAIYAASKLPFIRAVATVAAPAEVEHVKHLLENEIDVIEEEGKADVTLGGVPLTIKKQFLDDLTKHDVLEVVRELKKPILIMHSPQDTTVGISHAEVMYKEAKHPKSFVYLDKADHLLTNEKDAFYAGEVIAAWAKRYLFETIKNSG
jgi:putative redox protein